MAKQQRGFGLKVAFIVCAGIALSLSVGLSLYWLGVFNSVSAAMTSEAAGQTGRYKHISLSDADHACDQHARAEFGERIWVLTLDRRSSRLDRDDKLFKLFYQVDLFPRRTRQGQTTRYYINCYTALDRPTVESFQYASEGDGVYRNPDDDGTGLFGL